MMDPQLPLQQNLRILVVEDHVDTLDALTRLLRRKGHTVTPATSMAEAVDRYPASHCQVIISDVELPDGSGWDLLKVLDPPQATYAIAMTGRGLDDDCARSRAAGFHAHLLKPFRQADLNTLLTQAASELAGARTEV